MERKYHIINLYKTSKIEEANEGKIAASGRKILFVATKAKQRHRC
jgi:ribosomal protein S2